MSPRFIPVFRPALPRAAEVARYIEEIDARRHYTNRGALAERLEARLAAMLGRGGHAVRSASTGTSAIEIAILAHAGAARPERPLALMPAFTFAATALAAERCGYRPYFVDVDPATWALDPDRLARHPRIGEAGVILPVAPFGRLPDMRALEALQAATGVPVVLDAAAAFEALAADPAAVSARVPLTLSFHATKSFSTGEGGAVVWDDPAGQARVVQAANFGFLGSREARMPGTNAKLSEYHAAVGLAMLDALDTHRVAWAGAAALWRGTAGTRDLGGRLHLAPEVSPAYALWEAPTPEGLRRAQDALTALTIETRCWYEAGLHLQPHFAACGADPMPVTASLSGRLLGLPVAPDLAAADVALVAGVLAETALAPAA